MALDGISSTQKFKGLSTDTKPTQNVPAMSEFIETDTGNKYEYSGTSWNKISTDGAAHVIRLDEIPGTAYNAEINDISTTKSTLTFANGIWALSLQYKRRNQGALTDLNAGLTADVDAAVAANNGLVLMGYSCRESAGTAAAAAFNIVNGATGAAAGKIIHEELAANEAKTVWFGPTGITCPLGISIDHVAGTVDVALHHRYTGKRIFFVRNATDGTDADTKLGNATTRESIWIDETAPTIITADSLTSLITRLDLVAEYAENEDTIIVYSAVGNAP